MKCCLQECDYSRSGIYQITNTKTKKRYIGRAYNFFERFSYHLKCLCLKDHFNHNLQNDYDLYDDKDIFIFSILKKCAKEEVVFYEQHFLDEAKANKKMFYNICFKSLGGDTFTNRSKTSQNNSIQKRKETLINSTEIPGVYCYGLDGYNCVYKNKNLNEIQQIKERQRSNLMKTINNRSQIEKQRIKNKIKDAISRRTDSRKKEIIKKKIDTYSKNRSFHKNYKPFYVTINGIEMFFESEKQFLYETKFNIDVLRELKKSGMYAIKKRQKNTRHIYPVGSVLYYTAV